MKKTIFISLFAACLLASCGGNQTKSNEDAVAVDSTVVDSVAVVGVPADTVVAVVDSVAAE